METPLEIAFKDTDKSEHLESLIRRQAERLDRHYPKLIGCRVVVDVPHRSPGSGKVPLRVTVEVEAPGKKTFVGRAEQQTHAAKDDTTAALNRAFDAVQRQLGDHAELRRRDVKHHAGAGETGRVLRLFPDYDYGFVEVGGGPELYFSRQAVENGAFEDLEIGSMVEVTAATTEGPMGPQASSVRCRGADRFGN